MEAELRAQAHALSARTSREHTPRVTKQATRRCRLWAPTDRGESGRLSHEDIGGLEQERLVVRFVGVLGRSRSGVTSAEFTVDDAASLLDESLRRDVQSAARDIVTAAGLALARSQPI
jgi:hypothetical protein